MRFFTKERIPSTLEQKRECLRETWDIYTYSFPKHERRAFSSYEKVCQNETAFVPYTLRDENGAPIGLFWYWETEDGVYLEHFAIEKSHRNGGLGAEILGEFLQLHPNVVLEAEEPVDALTRRRIGFYQRNGMIFNGFTYTNPGYWTTPIDHQLCLVSSQPMNPAQCQAFVDQFIMRKPLAYVADLADES